MHRHLDCLNTPAESSHPEVLLSSFIPVVIHRTSWRRCTYILSLVYTEYLSLLASVWYYTLHLLCAVCVDAHTASLSSSLPLFEYFGPGGLLRFKLQIILSCRQTCRPCV